MSSTFFPFWARDAARLVEIVDLPSLGMALEISSTFQFCSLIAFSTRMRSSCTVSPKPEFWMRRYTSVPPWRELRRIPPGETRSYTQIAAAAGNPGAVRAAGSANGANHVAVLIPCHRVVRSDGTVGGYAYGPEIKRALLERERSAGSAQERARLGHRLIMPQPDADAGELD